MIGDGSRPRPRPGALPSGLRRREPPPERVDHFDELRWQKGADVGDDVLRQVAMERLGNGARDGGERVGVGAEKDGEADGVTRWHNP
jgi:hypothetical protein